MAIQTIYRGVEGDSSKKFTAGSAFDTAQENDEYLDSVKPTVIENVAALASTPVVAGRTYYLKEYNAGTGKGGGELVGVAGSTTYDNWETFAGSGGYFRRINYKDDLYKFGCVIDDSTDDTVAFQRAVDSGLPLHHERGTMVLTSPITSTTNLILYGAGSIDATGVTGSVLKCSGTLTAIPDISTVSAAAQAVVFASTHGLVTNDVFVIYNPTDYSYSGFRSNYRAGEWCQVKSVSGLNVKLKSPLYAGYTGSAVDIYKLVSGIVYIDGITIEGANNLPIEISKVINPVVKNINVSCLSNTAVYFDKCWMPLGDNCTINNVGAGTDDYGIVLGSCQHAKITNSNIYSRRHAIATGGDAEIGCVTNRDNRITTSTLRNDTDSGTHCADFHGDTEDCSYEHCNIYGGVSWQGKNNHYRSCSIYAMDIGTVLYSAEILGGDFSLTDCDLYTTVDPSASSRGVIDVGGNNDALTSNTASDCNFIVRDCRLNGSNLSNITAMMRVRVAGSTVKINIDYNGNSHKVDDMGSPVLASVSSGSTSPDFVIVDNCSGIPNAKLLANLTGGFSTAPMRMQRCAGSAQGTTSTSAPSVNVDVVFRYTYPKIPVVNVTKSLRNYNGNRVGIAISYIPLTTGSKLGLYTDDATNFSAAQTFDFNWSAEISEV